jgi:hypothetical protein
MMDFTFFYFQIYASIFKNKYMSGDFTKVWGFISIEHDISVPIIGHDI